MALLVALGAVNTTTSCAPQRAPAGRIAVARVPEPAPSPRHAPGPPLRTMEPAPVPDAPPKRAAAHDLVARAEVAFLERRDVAAAGLVERAVALDPTFPASYVLLARMHLQRQDPELALTFLDRAEQLAAQDPRVLGEVESLRGAAFEGLGERAAAVAAYERALHFAPDNARARGGLARLTP